MKILTIIVATRDRILNSQKNSIITGNTHTVAPNVGKIYEL